MPLLPSRFSSAARRAIAALARIGEPLPPEGIAPIDGAEARGDIAGAARAAAAALDQRSLLVASITAEARVSVRQAGPPPQLAQAGMARISGARRQPCDGAGADRRDKSASATG